MRRKLSTATLVGMRLRRGYALPAANAMEVDLRREEADDFAARVPVDKLVFVVHGIGQVKSASNCFGSVWGDPVACLPVAKHSVAYSISCMTIWSHIARSSIHPQNNTQSKADSKLSGFNSLLYKLDWNPERPADR